ncbi:c-type cytochrome biogenesis protein CcmI [Methylocaldum sp.]|uniref:c-type cytochrome biogenesis protein CcmI n=1 Tax=Methylocaldum sp. TaxID=1969727 RepID=UPI002D3F4279|nr:c-type cytochrome biogenesis protein CcmI [Methylocaldum sp.]HYE36226.1 c-type cytochrome biogenesis protein CcmI [Methylocaldum sp.]
MMGFWLSAALLLTVGYVFFLPALLGKTGGGRVNRARLNVLLHRQRQTELAQEAASPEDLERLTAESERNLLGDLEAVEEKKTESSTRGRPAVIATLMVLPVLALTLYLALGRIDLIGTQAPENMADVQDSIRQLADRLAKQPNDLEGWVLLARSLQATNQPDKAVTAYEFALKVAPEDLDVKALYAQALAETHQGSMAGKPTEIVDEILKKNPDHQTALWMAGIAAAERKDAAKTVEYWERLKKQFAPGSEESKQIAGYIAQVQGLPAPTGPTAPAAATSAGKNIRVTVTLAENLKSRVSPDDALFVFARAAEGPPMPLAVVRKQAKDLPVEVVLDDSMSMMQGMTLSTFDRIVIGARISKGGQPKPEAGDLQGLSEALAPEDNGSYKIVVDQIVGQEAGR